jgi:rhamnulokinase
MFGHAGARLAIDLGAASGRVFLGQIQHNLLKVQEIHRFPNHAVSDGLTMRWDVGRLWSDVRSVFTSTDLPEIASVGVDAWGVDYALLGGKGELLEAPLHYRDPRNVTAMEEVLQIISKEEIYRDTGVQFMPINTLYQLFAAMRDTPDILRAARKMLMIPDLFHYWLSGKARCEYTAASTTQFANAVSRSWARSLLEKLGLPAHLPAPIVEPGSVLGMLLPELRTSQLRQTCVVAPASHDTASAVAAVSASGDTAFLSSGTWSLLGIEVAKPAISPDALHLNFTNEGGVGGTTRLLKNVTGLWLLQCVRKSFDSRDQRLTYNDLIEAAARAEGFQHLVDPDDASFLNPEDMLASVDAFCHKTDQPAPACPGAYVRAILESLAFRYRFVIRSLEQIVGHRIDRIRVIGGGSQNGLLNQFTANATGKLVLAGPAEAAVLGNLGVQMITTGEIGSLRELRALVDRSFRTDVYEPVETDLWAAEARRFQQYCEFSYA